jgi:hypothetical protein
LLNKKWSTLEDQNKWKKYTDGSEPT